MEAIVAQQAEALQKGFVRTIKGDVQKKKDCTKIREQFHLRGRDCFQIRGKWVSIEYNSIYIDRHTGLYEFKKNLKECIVGYDPIKNKLIQGYTSVIENENFYFINGKTGDKYVPMNYKLLESLPVEECHNSGEFFIKGTSPYKRKIGWNKENYAFRNVASYLMDRGATPEQLGITSKKFDATGGLKYTFGVEIETKNGVLSEKSAILNQLNIASERDGSIQGGEYITGVLTGDSGLKQLKSICKHLSKNVEVNLTGNKICGIHVHIGNTVFNDEFTIFAYLLGLKLQNSNMFDILPISRTFIKNEDGMHRNDYCRDISETISPSMLKDFKEAFNEREANPDRYMDSSYRVYNSIFKWLSGGYDNTSKCNRDKEHPKGNKCGYDKSTPRYCWLNLIPANFNTRKNKVYTIEFRPYSATTDYEKIRNWVLLSMAFVNYVDNHKSKILEPGKITVQDIISAAFPNNEDLLDYFTKREGLFKPQSRSSSYLMKTDLPEENDFPELTNYENNKI